MSISSQLINIQQYCRKSNVGEEQAASVGPASGKHRLQRYRKSCEHIYLSNLLPETRERVGVANFSPWDALFMSGGVTVALTDWNQRFLQDNDKDRKKKQVLWHPWANSGRLVVWASCEHQQCPRCITSLLVQLCRAQGWQPAFPALGWVCKVLQEFSEPFSLLSKFDIS